MLKSFIATIILFIGSVMLIASSAFAIPTIASTHFLDETDSSSNMTEMPADEAKVKDSVMDGASDRPSLNAKVDLDNTAANVDDNYDREAMDDNYDPEVMRQFEAELYEAEN